MHDMQKSDHESNVSAEQVIGRDNEVARVVQVLARKRKNNPILLGEPGVGKTAIAEGLARAIVSGQQHPIHTLSFLLHFDIL